MNTAMYLRKSRAEELSDTVEETLKRHREILTEYAVQNGLTITGIYEEVISGESLYARPKMLELMEAVEQGQYDAVLCMDIDRLGRGTMSDQGIILETLKNAGVKIITPRKIYDLNNEMDETYTEFETFLARQELKAIKRRMQRGIRKSIEEGGYLSNAPYGYRKTTQNKHPTLAVNEEEARFVRLIFELYVHQSMGCQQIADTLNALGAKPHRAACFGRTSVLKILTNQVYIGKIVWNQKSRIRHGSREVITIKNSEENWTVVDGIHPPILDPELFRQAQAIRASRSRPPVKSEKTENPLAGLVYCANCGTRMQRQILPNGVQRLLCPRRGCMASSSLPLVEKTVLNNLKARLGEPVLLLEPLPSPRETADTSLLVSVETQKRTVLHQLETLHDLLEQGVYDTQTFLSRQNALNQKLEELKQLEFKLKSISHINYDKISNKTIDFFSFYWNGSSLQKNRILKALIQKIIYRKQKGAPASQFLLDIYLKPFYPS